MSFKTSDYKANVKAELNFSRLADETFLSAAVFIVDEMYNYYNWKEYRKKDESLDTSTTENYVSTATITDLQDINMLFLDEIKKDNRIKRLSNNDFILFDREDADSIKIYCDNLVNDFIYFDNYQGTAQDIILLYNKVLVNVTALTDDIPFTDKFKSAFYQGLLWYCSPYANKSIQIVNNFRDKFYLKLSGKKNREVSSFDDSFDEGTDSQFDELNSLTEG